MCSGSAHAVGSMDGLDGDLGAALGGPDRCAESARRRLNLSADLAAKKLAWMARGPSAARRVTALSTTSLGHDMFASVIVGAFVAARAGRRCAAPAQPARVYAHAVSMRRRTAVARSPSQTPAPGSSEAHTRRASRRRVARLERGPPAGSVRLMHATACKTRCTLSLGMP